MKRKMRGGGRCRPPGASGRAGGRALIAAAVLAFGAPAGLTASGQTAADPANWRRVEPENLLQLTVNRQTILIELAPQLAPGHVERVRTVARAGHYDGIPFHRVIDDFMAQGGEVGRVYMLPQPYAPIPGEFLLRRDPAQRPVHWIGGAESAAVGYLDGFVVAGQSDFLADMAADRKVDTWALHCSGVASMARTEDPDSADTQFFLVRQPSNFLDRRYTVWGRALTGLDVIRTIKAGERGEQDGAVDNPDKLTKAVIVADLPPERRPVVHVQRTDGPDFRARIEGLTPPAGEDACSVPAPEVLVEPARS